MKATGIVRKLDELGRVVIPVKLRRTLGIEDNTALEIHIDNDLIILQKYKPSSVCIFCGCVDEVIKFRGKNVCKECLATISERAV